MVYEIISGMYGCIQKCKLGVRRITKKEMLTLWILLYFVKALFTGQTHLVDKYKFCEIFETSPNDLLLATWELQKAEFTSESKWSLDPFGIKIGKFWFSGYDSYEILCGF